MESQSDVGGKEKETVIGKKEKKKQGMIEFWERSEGRRGTRQYTGRNQRGRNARRCYDAYKKIN